MLASRKNSTTEMEINASSKLCVHARSPDAHGSEMEAFKEAWMRAFVRYSVSALALALTVAVAGSNSDIDLTGF